MTPELFTLHWGDAPPADWHRAGPNERAGAQASASTYLTREAAERAARRIARRTGRAVTVGWHKAGAYRP